MVLGLLLGQAPLAHQLLDERVIVGQALEPAVAQQVGATVADVRDRDLVLADVGGRQRRPHARPLCVAARQLVDPLVGFADELGEPLLGRYVARRQPPREELDRRARGDLARLRAAHPVGDDEQRHADEEVVLVGAPLSPRVALEELVGYAQQA